ncbi:MAG: hypothetical protein HQK59_00115 [Deltaproteobacteria bacterium]|nr:hypothetical protein [Deltaproteobacteria bacterium]
MGLKDVILGDPEGKTLYEKWRDRGKEKPVRNDDTLSFNPVHAQVGGYVLIDGVELKGQFEIKAVALYDKGYDQILRCLIEDGEQNRILEIAAEDRTKELKYFLFTLVDEFGFNEDFYNELGGPDLPDPNGLIYTNSLRTKAPIKAQVTIVEDPFDSVTEKTFEIWAYSRKRDDGQDEYLHIEMDTDDGWILLQTGIELIATDISFLPAPKA